MPVESHILAVDLGATNTRLGIFAVRGPGTFEQVRFKNFPSRKIRNLPTLLREFLESEESRLHPPVRAAAIGYAGPVDARRSRAFITNLGWLFTAREVFDAVPIEELTLLNDFEAVGFGLEVLLSNAPQSFVRLSTRGKVSTDRKRPTIVLIGAGTGLGTAIVSYDPSAGRYRPIPGEGGHVDFAPVDEIDYQVSRWIRTHRNRSETYPADWEKIVSGPGLVNTYCALADLDSSCETSSATHTSILQADPFDQPAMIAAGAQTDDLCRRALDFWLRCYARVAKNFGTFPLATGGIFLAGGIAAKLITELQSGIFMAEFVRHDIPEMRNLLKKRPVFVVTESRIGLFGCVNVAVNFANELGLKR